MSFNKKKGSSSSKSKSSSSKPKTVQIGQYLVSKDKKTKYLKQSARDKNGPKAAALVKKLVKLLGSEVIFVNLYDQEFKDKYKIQDFVKGTIQVSADALNKIEEEDEDEDQEDADESEEEDSEDEEDGEDF